MTLDEVRAFLATLEGCHARRVDGRQGWYVDGLLVARTDAPGTLLVRLGGTDRERLVAQHPDTFGVPPAWEAHTKVQADLARDRALLEEALHLAWERQRAARTT